MTFDTLMLPTTAETLIPNLLRAWEIVRRISGYRATAKRNKVRDAILQYVLDTVAEHYNFNRPVAANTAISDESIIVFVDREIELLETLAVRMVQGIGTPALEPKQVDYRRVFVYSAVTAGQLLRVPMSEIRLGNMPAHTHHATIDA